ncbi:MAG: PilZ domain-containing protein [Acidobacteria bacterium]|nr:PilZ domain-containing protein [Acidobacteriota bacterium]
MDPRDLRRTVQDDIRKVLGDPAARGDGLAGAIEALAARHPIEPFRAVLGCAAALDRPEDEAGSLVLAIDRHRSSLEGLMGRDPGFAVAACDLLHEVDRTLREPVFRSGAAATGCGPGVAALPLEEALRREARRAGRSGRPLAVVALSPEGRLDAAADALEAARLGLCDSARDVDFIGSVPPHDFIILLPCTGGRQGLLAAGRFRRSLLAATGAAWCAGVASCAGPAADAVELTRSAREAIRTARRTGAGQALYRQERRAHARSTVGPSLPARLRRDGVESVIVLEDLSLGGALLTVHQRIDPGAEVILALRQGAAPPASVAIPSRVLRVADGPVPGQAPWRAAVAFPADAGLRVAGVLSGIGPGAAGETR